MLDSHTGSLLTTFILFRLTSVTNNSSYAKEITCTNLSQHFCYSEKYIYIMLRCQTFST